MTDLVLTRFWGPGWVEFGLGRDLEVNIGVKWRMGLINN